MLGKYTHVIRHMLATPVEYDHTYWFIVCVCICVCMYARMHVCLYVCILCTFVQQNKKNPQVIVQTNTFRTVGKCVCVCVCMTLFSCRHASCTWSLSSLVCLSVCPAQSICLSVLPSLHVHMHMHHAHIHAY